MTIYLKKLVEMRNLANIEMRRLHWTGETYREYLLKTYGKRGMVLLTEKELSDFVEYLQSL